MNKVIKLSVSVKTEVIADLLDSSSRGASYWCENSLEYESIAKKAFTKTGALVKDIEKGLKCYMLNIKKIEKGLAIMAKKEPKYFADILSEDFDETTGDIFLQYCLFGKVVYC